ncbi:pentapeptide repeat-containing protein [Listeria monocytogenes]|nr:pentapeptide repeat-containing protein [Listeria monocytogenes]
MKLTKEQLQDILKKHKVWLNTFEVGEYANLRNYNLYNYNLSKIDLRKANLSGSNLGCVDLSESNLSGADLSSVDLSYADLTGADLSCANLSGANLRKANLTGVSLVHANLSGADLSGTNLSGTDLNKAKLNWVNWQNVKGLTVIATQINTFNSNDQISYIKELNLWTTDCFQGTLEQLKDDIKKTYMGKNGRKERYYRAIDFILTEAE